MNIRAATLTDIPEISALLTQLTQDFIAPTCTVEGAAILVNAMSMEAIASYFMAGYQYHVAMSDSGQLAGVVAMKDNSHLYHLFVASHAQGQGVARMLWEHAKTQCLAQGNPGVFTVNSALNAQAVYLGFGFMPLGPERERGGIRDIPMQLML